jgi:hypothetical protein
MNKLIDHTRSGKIFARTSQYRAPSHQKFQQLVTNSGTLLLKLDKRQKRVERGNTIKEGAVDMCMFAFQAYVLDKGEMTFAALGRGIR